MDKNRLSVVRLLNTYSDLAIMNLQRAQFNTFLNNQNMYKRLNEQTIKNQLIVLF